MSGAEVAAYIGLLDISARGISSISKAASDWKHAPRTIEALAKETSTLQRNLSELAKLQRANGETRAIAERIGLSGAVAACEDHCARLETHFSRWKSSTSKYRIKARFHYISHRSELASLLTEIQTAKQTTILSVLVAQLSLRLRSPMSSKEQQDVFTHTVGKIKDTGAKTGRKPQQEQAIKEAEKQLKTAQVTTKYPNGDEKSTKGSIIQDFNDIEVDGDGNVVGVKAAESQNVPAGVVNTFIKVKTLANSKNSVVGISFG
ncbi:hypothetical protein CC80DRAFT_493226 [Byssothecium circinans]|uniref:Fungal N-terminal domain-containing protein n=1 Tax=Byssothecium circinans TaxID=147558 RepID=A0A6A5TSR5_9PLEO|nr:hypothetical protein CC80DRAFT_493226 [Byssothecium circinans]